MINVNANVQLMVHNTKVQLKWNGPVLLESKAIGPELSSRQYQLASLARILLQ